MVVQGNPVKIGVAGYMGSGKSTAAGFIADSDGLVIDADTVAKELMGTSDEIRASLREEFGSEVVEDGQILFSVLRTRVFRDRGRLESLNRIVHPPLLERLHTLLDQSGPGRRVLDAALIPYWGIQDWFDHLVWVETSRDTRLERLASRVGLGADELARDMDIQEAQYALPGGKGWLVVHNEGTECDLRASLAQVGMVPADS
jgi:dephospho-CoA kinase